MRVVLQRVQEASCTIDKEVTGAIAGCYCLFAGFGPQDTDETLQKMIAKIVKLRVFSDEEGRMNRNIVQAGGSVLSISQFTLYADCRKGNRPGFTLAASPALASALYDRFNELLAAEVPVQTGRFGADMQIALINDGPVTITLDSEELGF